jgi:hypothetical protein
MSDSPLRLLAELLDMDQLTRSRRARLTTPQKQRRQVVCQSLRSWALAHQQTPEGAPQRRHPRAPVHLKVQLLGGPRPIELETDSLAVGGICVRLNFQPHVKDLLPLRLLPPPPDGPIEVMGEVVWYDPIRARAGVRLGELDEDAVALLERLVYGELLKLTPEID